MKVNDGDFDAVLAELTALSFLVWHQGKDSEPIDGFGFGLGQIIFHIQKDLENMKEEAEKEET